jgi:hypothetical protein
MGVPWWLVNQMPSGWSASWPHNEGAAVDGAVVAGAHGDQVGGVGGAAVLPVRAVVEVEPAVVGAARDAAAAVAVLDDAAGVGGCDASGAADRDRGAVVVAQPDQGCVAAQQRRHGIRDRVAGG